MCHKILIADDDPEIIELLSAYLGKSLGYCVVTADDGETALESASREAFDLCIMDVLLPGISGAEAYRRLKTLQPEIEVIFFTAIQSFEHTMDFMRFSLPPERVIVKPLEELSQLTRVIIGILGPPSA